MADKHKKKAIAKKRKTKKETSVKKAVMPSANLEHTTYESSHYIDTQKPVWNFSLLTEEEVRNFKNGTHVRLYKKFGAHAIHVNDKNGMYFCVWAPNATAVSVKGHFNNWQNDEYALFPRWDESGIWEGFIPGLGKGEAYKYNIVGYAKRRLDKGDPFANYWEKRPATASITWDLSYQWSDQAWMKKRKRKNSFEAPWSIYEVHLASWQRPDKNDAETFNTYEQIKNSLVPYVKKMGFTHVEFMPVMEHPYDGSWGYQCTGFFAATSRFGDPQGLMELINAFHHEDIGVILDWVPSHFPYDAHGLFMFDGAHTYEYDSRQKGYHPDWNSYIFNYQRGEVRSFLLSSAVFWFDVFHADGIRVDAVSSMLKLDYSRKEGEWEPNELGGNGNLEAISFIKDLNEVIYKNFPGVQTIAEEATDWPGVTKPIKEEGLGFGMKWMMGWMHDTLDYFKLDSLHRQFHQDKFTFSMMYFYHEKFMLPLSHDEVVHGKSPMLYKMPGDEWQQFANLRLLYTYMWAHPGARLLFMGNEFGQTNEWNYQSELQWDLLAFDAHHLLQNCVRDLNLLLQKEKALHGHQFEQENFQWVDLDHRQESVVSFLRKGKQQKDDLLIILNMTPVVRHDWEIEVQGKVFTTEIFNSDSNLYWGSGKVFNPEIRAEILDKNQKKYKMQVNLPPLAGIILK